MASASKAVAIDKASNGSFFISWKEKVVNESDVGRRIDFFLQLQNFKWVLAVTGVQTLHNNMKFAIDPSFYLHYRQSTTGLGNGEWDRRCDVVVWLEAQISNGPFVDNNDHTMFTDETEIISQVMDAGDFSKLIDSEGARASMAFPSGFVEAYSIPSRAQMFLKHGGRRFDVIVEEGYLTHGWSYFVGEHDIQIGYVVKFHFVGCSTYEIEIFDRKRSKKVYPWSNLEYHNWI